MKLPEGKKPVKPEARKGRIETDEKLIPTCSRCPDNVILAEVDYGDGVDWFFCLGCDELFEEVEVSWLDESELEEEWQ